MSIKISSAKAKGRKLEAQVAEDIQKEFSLELRDVVRNSASCVGMDIILSERAKIVFPFAVECKARESLNIWQALDQAEINSENLTPVLVFKRNHSRTYACVDWQVFLQLVKDSKLQEAVKDANTP